MTSKEKKKESNQQQKKYTELKRITRRRFLRCNHELSHVISSSRTHSHTTYSTSSLVQTLKYNRCKFAFISIFVFNTRISNLIHAEPMLSKISEVYEWDKKPLQKVFTLHYWRFFWFKYLFSLFCITLICLWSCLLGNIMWRIHRVRAEGETERSSHIHTLCTLGCFCIWTSMCIFNPGLGDLLIQLFSGPLSDPWLRRRFCLSSSCLRVQKKQNETKKIKGASDFQH